ncbi:MAG: hydrolase [bacterium]|nr:hydrolase [bacterium]
MKEVKILGLNCVSVPVLVEAKNLKSSRMRISYLSKIRAIKIIRALKKEGIKFIIEPYPWIGKGYYEEIKWDPADKEKWFANWKKVLLDISRSIAIPYNAYAIVTASNYINMENGYDKEWIDIFNSLRNLKNFNSLITYKTNFWVTAIWDKETKTAYTNKLNNSLFSEIDFISIAFYFELNNKEKIPSVETLKKDLRCVSKFNRCQDVYKEIENFYYRHKKPVFFGELGAPRRVYAASEPWNCEPHIYAEVETAEFSEEAQANYFRAVLETFQDKDWFYGASIFAIGMPSSSYSTVGK